MTSFFSYAQNDDAHVWTGVGVSYDVIEDITIDYKTQTRFYKNASSLRVFMNQVGASFKITKGVKAGVDYRYSRKKKDYYFVNENRFILYGSYGYKIPEISTKISARVKYQHSFDRLNTINETITPNTSDVFRIKISAKYKNSNFKRVQPFVGYEYFESLNATSNQFGKTRYRISLGLNLDLPMKHAVKLNYIYQSTQKTIPEVDHIFAIQYSYDLSNLF